MTHALAPFRMPTLLVLSGLLLPQSLSKTLADYSSGKIRKILYPLIVWSIITLVCASTAPHEVGHWGIIGGVFHLWFLFVLLCAYTAAIAARWIPMWLLPVMMITLLVLRDPSTNTIRRALFFGSIFFIGALLYPHLRSWLEAPPTMMVPLALAAVAISACSVTEILRIHHRTPWTIVLTLPGILVLVWAWARIPRRLPRLEFVGRRSLVFYVSHFPVQVLATRSLAAVGITTPWIHASVALALGLAIPLALALHYPKVSWLFESPRLRGRTQPGDQGGAARAQR